MGVESKTYKISSDYEVLTPAYGRDFETAEAVEKNFREGKDFRLWPEGVYCSIRNFSKDVIVILRYAKRTKYAEVRV